VFVSRRKAALMLLLFVSSRDRHQAWALHFRRMPVILLNYPCMYCRYTCTHATQQARQAQFTYLFPSLTFLFTIGYHVLKSTRLPTCGPRGVDTQQLSSCVTVCKTSSSIDGRVKTTPRGIWGSGALEWSDSADDACRTRPLGSVGPTLLARTTMHNNTSRDSSC